METMETNERQAVGSVVDALIAEPQGYNLFQAISLLERAGEPRTNAGVVADKQTSVPLRSVVSLAFQPSDVSKITTGSPENASFTVHTAVMSLAGANGPLPLPFTEMVLERTAARDHATADFLDIFNQRFLAFLYRGRKKHNIGLSGVAPGESPLASCLDSLSALGLKAGVRSPTDEAGWLAHAGLMGGAPRSMTGLLAMLSDRFGVQAEGRQFCGGWRNLESRDLIALGEKGMRRAPSLGVDAVLGRRVWDQSAGICIELKNLGLSRLHRFLKGGDERALLHWMVRRYLPQDMDVEMVLKLKEGELEPTVLSRKRELRLGWTSWLVTAGSTTDAIATTRFRLDADATAVP